MLDPRLLREQPDTVSRGRAKARASRCPCDAYLDVDVRRRRNALRDVEERKARRNRLSQAVAVAKRRGEDATARSPSPGRSATQIGELERRSSRRWTMRSARWPSSSRTCLHPDVPTGADRRGERRGAPALGRAAPVRLHAAASLGGRRDPGDPRLRARDAGSRSRASPCCWGLGARLERALAQLMLELHTNGARVPGGLGPSPGQHRDDGRHRPAPEVRGGAVQDRRARARPRRSI